MKPPFASLLLVVLALAGAGHARGAPPRGETARVAGPAYVRLTDWAKSNGFEVRWLKQDETLQLTNRWSKILVAADSREAQINGVRVWLLHPVVAQSGTLCLAQPDVEKRERQAFAGPDQIRRRR